MFFLHHVGHNLGFTKSTNEFYKKNGLNLQVSQNNVGRFSDILRIRNFQFKL